MFLSLVLVELALFHHYIGGTMLVSPINVSSMHQFSWKCKLSAPIITFPRFSLCQQHQYIGERCGQLHQFKWCVIRGSVCQQHLPYFAGQRLIFCKMTAKLKDQKDIYHHTARRLYLSFAMIPTPLISHQPLPTVYMLIL